MSNFCVRVSATTAVMILLAASVGVSAHHSYSMFDLKETKTLVGTVKQFEWTNPHSWLWVYVPNGAGAIEQWGIEGMSPNYLGRRGWSRNTLKAGDKITLEIHPLKNGERGGTFLSVTLPDGKVMRMTGDQARAAAEGAARKEPAASAEK